MEIDQSKGSITFLVVKNFRTHGHLEDGGP